jgi:DNA polymerase elongation subunit (family B)
MEDLVFQIVSWHTTDIECEEEDENSGDECNQHAHLALKYCMKVFGVDETGNSVSATITDFTPFFYVKVYYKWNGLQIESLRESLIAKLPRRYKGSMIEIKPFEKKDFWGYTGEKKFWFLRLCFDSHIVMKKVSRILSKPLDVYGNNQKWFKVYESNIEPFLRFAHIKDIEPAGWIRIPASKYKPNYELLCSKCSKDVIVHWKHVESVKKESIAPLRIASFDIECTSSDGDFPVAAKTYQKIATELFNLFNDMKKRGHDDTASRDQAIKYITTLFQDKKVIPKEAIDIDKIHGKLLMHMEHIQSLVLGKLSMDSYETELKEDYIMEKIQSFGLNNRGVARQLLNTYADLKSQEEKVSDSFIMRKIHSMIAERQSYIPEDAFQDICDMLKERLSKKDLAIKILTKLKLPKVLPPLEGDPIIQIGITVHRYGDLDVQERYLLSLGECGEIDETEVISCPTEAELLLAFVDLFNKLDPDVVTGYNIFGFDFAYMHDRAKELGIHDAFCEIGRLKDHVSAFKQAKLSSSALGDNVMKYVDMEGRTIVDIMKVVQREYKLDSYKLDNVANHFMKMNKKDVSPQDIFNLYRGGCPKDIATIGDYCVQDCALCNKLIMKLEIIANNIGMANVCSVPMSYIFLRGQGVKIFSLIAKECRDKGFIIPVIAKPRGGFDDKLKGGDGEDGEAEEEEEGYEGAIVLEPKTGIYIDDPVTVLDYASLYPSSMISENLSHDCIVLDEERYGNLKGVKYNTVTYDIYDVKGGEKTKVGEKVCKFVEFPEGRKGVIPNILNHLLKQRKLTRKRILMKKVVMKDGTEYHGWYKKGEGEVVNAHGEVFKFDEEEVVAISDLYNNFQKAVLDGLQLAYKITANSLYGQIGARTSPVYMKDIAACTTATGRKMIMLAKEFAEKEYHANVVYGDSVTGDTPLILRLPDGTIDIMTIETLCNQWKPYKEFMKVGDQKEQGFIYAQVWANDGWANIKRVIRHKTKKTLYRVNTFRGCVDVTEDHSLIGKDGKEIKPGDCVEGETEVAHTFPTEFVEHDVKLREFVYNDCGWEKEAFQGEYECIDCKVQDKVLGYNVPERQITKEEAWVWGFFFGDGSCGFYECKSGDKYSWAINNSNLQFLEKAKGYLEAVEDPKIVSFRIMDTIGTSGVYKLAPKGSPAYMVEKYRELMYDKDKFKKVPKEILNASHEVRMWFMRGYLTADGAKGQMAKGQWDWACKGKIGAQGLFYVMKSLGWKDIGIRVNDTKENTYFVRTLKQEKYIKHNGDKVLKVIPLPYIQPEFVYDIETEHGVFHGGVGECKLMNTDSIMLAFDIRDDDGNKLKGKDALEKCRDIGLSISESIKPLLKYPHDLEWEKMFWPFILFSKKRYVANKYEHDVTKFKQVSMGIALKRRDNAPIVKHIYGGIIDIILNQQDVKASVQFLNDSLMKLIKGDMPIEDFVITKTLKGHYKDPEKIAHKVLAERIKERSPGNAPQTNDRIPFAYVQVKAQKGKNILQGERIEHPDFIKENDIKLDYQFYITNQLMNPIVQLYAIVLENLEGYKRPDNYWNGIKTKLRNEKKTEKQIKEKLQDLRENEAKEILFGEILKRLENKKNGQMELTNWYKPI